MRVAAFAINKLMPLWLIVLGVIAVLFPEPFLPLKALTTFLLGGVILVMSLTLTFRSMGQVFRHPKALLIGFIVKWLTVPAAGYLAARLIYANQPQLAGGTILDASVPAGVSSNLFTFIGHGSVALAVTLTFVHTILSPVLTPGLTKLLASRFVSVDFLSLMVQMLEMVLVPVILGLVIRSLVGSKRLAKAEPVFPMISAIFLYLIELGLVAPASPAIHANLGWMPIVTATTTALCIVNLLVAYVVSRLLRVDRREARAIMFDTGVYNSGLGAVLASANFGPFAALPPLMNSVMNLIVGALLASVLQNYPITESGEARDPAAEGVAHRKVSGG